MNEFISHEKSVENKVQEVVDNFFDISCIDYELTDYCKKYVDTHVSRYISSESKIEYLILLMKTEMLMHILKEVRQRSKIKCIG